MLSRPLREALMRRCLEANAAGDQDRVNGIVALLERHWNNRAEAAPSMRNCSRQYRAFSPLRSVASVALRA